MTPHEVEDFINTLELLYDDADFDDPRFIIVKTLFQWGTNDRRYGPTIHQRGLNEKGEMVLISKDQIYHTKSCYPLKLPENCIRAVKRVHKNKW